MAGKPKIVSIGGRISGASSQEIVTASIHQAALCLLEAAKVKPHMILC